MTMERTAWLFTKDEESVRVEIRSTGEGVQLVIEGPGARISRYEFPAGTAVEGFRSDYEDKLLSDGYRLQAVSERRAEEKPEARSAERRRRRQA
jgi:hypothetical protein